MNANCCQPFGRMEGRIMRGRTFLAASTATWALPALARAERKRILKVGSRDPRSGLDHCLRDSQSRLHGIRHTLWPDRS